MKAPSAPEPGDALAEAPRRTKPTAKKPADWDRSEESTPKREAAPKPQIKAGTLTAGSLNDHENFEDYRDYLSNVQQSPAGQQLSAFPVGKRVMIEIQDSEGNGVPDVHITVTQTEAVQDENEGVLLDTMTRADGKTFFSSGFDVRSDAQHFELTVRPPTGKPFVQQVSIGQSPWIVRLPELKRELPQQLDLALVIDTTGSMKDELNYLKVEIDNIVSRVHRMFPNVDQRYALIVYRDEGEDYVRKVYDFTGSLSEFRQNLANQTHKGGGDTPEAMHIGLETSTKLSWRRENTSRVMFLVADAPPHRHHVDRTMAAVKDLRQKGVAIYPLAASGALDECQFLMRAFAFLTRGRYLFLTDHSGVGLPHAKPQAPKYDVEPLNQLMIRMIATELSGKEVLAEEVIATEENDGSDSPPIPQEQNQSRTDSGLHSHPEHLPATNQNGDAPELGQTLWASTWFRCVLAGLVIGGILLLDQRLRT